MSPVRPAIIDVSPKMFVGVEGLEDSEGWESLTSGGRSSISGLGDLDGSRRACLADACTPLEALVEPAVSESLA